MSERVIEAWDTEAVAPGGPIPLPGAATTPMPDDETDREILARRLVADRCLYGVDRNSMAVEMAKLSLWLITLAKDRPFTFVDHALRCGDSLLGITDLRQLDSFHLDPAKGRQLHGGTLFDPATRIEPLVKAALEKRRELESFTVIDIGDADAKRLLLDESNALLDNLRIVADLVVGAALSTATQKTEAHNNRLASVASEVAAALALDCSDDDRAVRLCDLQLKAAYWLDEGRPPLAPARRCFHWVLEFPEVFRDRAANGFDAVIGNPPFLGVTRIEGAMGTDYRETLFQYLQGGVAARADLVVFFLLQAARLVACPGHIGLIATRTLAQSGTRRVGLDALRQTGYTISRAANSRPWPGEATLSVCLVWLWRGSFAGQPMLDHVAVNAIDGGLESVSGVEWRQQRLSDPDLYASQGVMMLGAGFVLSNDAAAALLADDQRNADVVRPYMSGEDLNRDPLLRPSRYIIDFKDWTQERAETYPGPFDVVERLVLPERATNKHRERRERWWLFGGRAEGIRRAVAESAEIIVVTKVSKTVMPVVVRNDAVFADKVIMFAGDVQSLAVLSSSVHYWWAIETCGTLRDDLSYSPQDCIETMVLPSGPLDLQSCERLVEHRARMMQDRWEGLTKIYNRVHSQGERSGDIEALRALHVELDRRVFDAYGWNDLEPDHGFHETRQGVRYTIAPAARAEVRDRLLRLNAERVQAEVRRGLRTKGMPIGSAGTRKSAATQDSGSLF